MFEITPARNGNPTVKCGGAFLHSSYDPVREARETVARLDWKPGRPVIVLGFGLGYHVEALLERARQSGSTPEIHVIEWNEDLFRMAREARDLSATLSDTHVQVVRSSRDIERSKELIGLLSRQALVFIPPGLAKARPDLHNEIVETLNRLNLRTRLGKVRLKIMVVSPLYGGSLSTSVYVADAFKALGHHVEFMKFDAYQHAMAHVDDVTSQTTLRNYLHNQLCHFLSELCLARCQEWKPDLVFALAQSPLVPAAFRRMREMGIPTAFWFTEDFRLFPYWKDVAPACDYFFTIQKGAFFEELKKVTSNRYGYLPQACAPAVHRPIDLTPEERSKYGSDVSFMGAGYYNRQTFLLGLMHHDLKIWGTAWDPDSVLIRCVQDQARWLETGDVVRIYNASTINLNLHSSTYHEGVNPNGDFVNPRTFEIAAIGAFQLVDRRELLSELFEEGTEIVTFSDLREAQEKIDYYLAHEPERRAIAQAGQARARADHSFERRLESALDMILQWDYAKFAHRLEGQTAVQRLLEQAAGDPELTSLLQRYEDRGDVGFKDIVQDIQARNGELNDTEMVFLLLDQLWQERVVRPQS